MPKPTRRHIRNPKDRETSFCGLAIEALPRPKARAVFCQTCTRLFRRHDLAPDRDAAEHNRARRNATVRRRRAVVKVERAAQSL